MRRSINRWFLAAAIGTMLPALPVQARNKARDPIPHNIVSWFSDDDYPAAARRANETGAVQFEVVVGVDGKPESCRILQSSNSKALDEQTCVLVMERGQFDPALDRSGAPVRGTFVQRTRWTLDEPDPVPIGEPYRIAGILRIDNKGEAVSCIDAAPVGDVPGDAQPMCKSLTEFPAEIMLMLRGGTAGPVEVPVTFETSTVPDGKAAPAMTYLAASRHRITVDIAHFDIDGQGKAVNCRTIQKVFSPTDLCDDDNIPGPFIVRSGDPRGITVTLAVSRPEPDG